MLKDSRAILLIFSFAWLLDACKSVDRFPQEALAETAADADDPVTGEDDEGGAGGGGDDDPDPPPGSAGDDDTAQVITGVRFDFKTLEEAAPGSDNWALTWADDESQYASWGDGGGFEGTNTRARVSLGVARIDGGFDDFVTSNVWGGKNSVAKATFPGKSYGMLAVGPDLWLWRTGTASNDSAFDVQDLFVSRDYGSTFEPAGVRFEPKHFPAGRGFFAPTFLQFGPGYAGARDDYVYVYAPENKTGKWEVQIPGDIALLRVPMDQMANRDAYEFFGGVDSSGTPNWTPEIGDRVPVFSDPDNGVMRTAVTYNAGLERYLLVTQQRTHMRGGYIGIYEAATPWGPWNTVLFEDAWEVGLQDGEKSVYWNFSNKWTSADGKRSALVYTGPGPDNFGVVMAEFETADD